MNKKLMFISTLLIIAVITIFVFMYHRKKQIPFTIEWHTLTPTNIYTMRTRLNHLQQPMIDAYIPVIKPFIYATDPRFANIPKAKRQIADKRVIAGITKEAGAIWEKKIEKLYAGFENHNITKAYLAIAKDNQYNILGFSIFIETDIKSMLKPKIQKIIDGSLDPIDIGHDQVYVTQIAVIPAAQGRGIGKALLFSIFAHCPHITKIYLSTHANDFNKKTQAFYEHLGFKRVLRFTTNKMVSDFEKEKIVYFYKKSDKKLKKKSAKKIP